ncbi:MAG: tetratricopeptide repeat protein [Myxococcaceae bacterium]
MILRLLLILQQLFMLWMLVDAVRRRAEYHWIMIIFLPFGSWAYFFMVKIHDPELRRMRELFNFKRPPSLSELRARVEETPSLANQVTFAQGLHDAGEFSEAARCFTEILAANEDNREALYGRGMCRLALGELNGATEDLGEVVRLDRGFQDYEPWVHLARAHSLAGEREKALSVLEELCRTSPRIGHTVVLATYLSDAGRIAEARALLQEALRDYARAPRFVKRSNWRWALQARKLLYSLPAEPAPMVI